MLQRLARAILWLEPLLLALTVFAFWYPPPIRTSWLWLLLLLPLFMGARWVLHRRLLTRTPLDGWLLAFLALGVLNVYLAPYTRGLEMLARPLLGMAIYYAMIESARSSGSIRGPVQVVTILALLVGLLALTSSHWGNKAPPLRPIMDIMPRLQGFPGAEAGFNPNEIAGALAWLAPPMIVLALYRWQRREPRWDVTAAALMQSVALLLGQSRSALIGVLSALLVSLWLVARGRVWRVLAYAALGAVILLQAAVSVDFASREQQRVAPTRTEISAVPWQDTYNELNVRARLQMWVSALDILGDYPLTGVGLSMFRDGRVRAEYPVPLMRNLIIPHAHNEILQIASDMGLPGLVVFLGMHAAVGLILYRAWRGGDDLARAVSVGAAAGLLAHFIYGFGDAITLWDRFFFVLWVLFGLAGAQYVLVTRIRTETDL